MTALFVVIFVEQFLNDKEKINGFIGIGASVLCLLIFKAQNFMIPAMILMLAVILLRYKLRKSYKVAETTKAYVSRDDVSSDKNSCAKQDLEDNRL